MSTLELKRCLEAISVEHPLGEMPRTMRDRFLDDQHNPNHCGLYGANAAACAACTRLRDGLCDGGTQDEER